MKTQEWMKRNDGILVCKFPAQYVGLIDLAGRKYYVGHGVGAAEVKDPFDAFGHGLISTIAALGDRERPVVADDIENAKADIAIQVVNHASWAFGAICEYFRIKEEDRP